MPPIAAKEALAPRIGFGRVDEDVLRGLEAGEKKRAGNAEQRNGGKRGAWWARGVR